MPTIEDITAELQTGSLDKHLDILTGAIATRKAIQAIYTYVNIKQGDRVRFIASIKPKYLAGKMGTVRNKRTKKVTVDLDEPASARFFRGIIVPVHLIEIVNGTE